MLRQKNYSEKAEFREVSLYLIGSTQRGLRLHLRLWLSHIIRSDGIQESDGKGDGAFQINRGREKQTHGPEPTYELVKNAAACAEFPLLRGS